MLCYLAFCEYVLHLLGPMRKTPYASGDCGEYTAGFWFATTLLNVHGVTIFTLSHRFPVFTRGILGDTCGFLFGSCQVFTCWMCCCFTQLKDEVHQFDDLFCGSTCIIHENIHDSIMFHSKSKASLRQRRIRRSWIGWHLAPTTTSLHQRLF